MAKPWGKYEIDYISHPKFLALNANALALWWEVKNHCDKHHTDGMVQAVALRTFRFYSPKAAELLTRSCGPKPSGEPYAPLLEAIDIGGVPHLRMHDYLQHNACRDEVLERLQDADDKAELRRLRDRERKQRERQARQAEITTLRARQSTAVSADASADNGHLSADSPPDIEGVSADREAPVRTLSVAVPEAEVPVPVPSEREAARVLLTFPVVGTGGTTWALTEAQVAEWAACFPTIDVRSETRKAYAWLVANPGRRKTPKGMPRFLVSWLGRATDARPGSARPKPGYGGPSVSFPRAADWTCPDDPPCPPGTTVFQCHQRTAIAAAKRQIRTVG